MSDTNKLILTNLTVKETADLMAKSMFGHKIMYEGQQYMVESASILPKTKNTPAKGTAVLKPCS